MVNVCTSYKLDIYKTIFNKLKMLNSPISILIRLAKFGFINYTAILFSFVSVNSQPIIHIVKSNPNIVCSNPHPNHQQKRKKISKQNFRKQRANTLVNESKLRVEMIICNNRHHRFGRCDSAGCAMFIIFFSSSKIIQHTSIIRTWSSFLF